MKKYLNLSWCLLLALGISSCETDDDYLETKDLGGYAYLTDRSISIFDTNANLNIDFFTAEGVTAESVEILQDGEVIGSGTVSGETATFNTSIFGDLEEDSYPIRIRTTYSNGKISEDPFTVSVGEAITLGDNPSETNMDELDEVTLAYDISTFAASVDNVSLLLKDEEDGDFVDSGVTLSTESGTVNLNETNYEDLNLAEGDVLYYKFVASSGSTTDEVQSTLKVVPKAFQNSNSVVLSSDMTRDNLDLSTGNVTAEDGEITYLDPTGFEVAEGADIDFVQVPDNFFNNLSEDVINAREAYMAGSPVTSSTNLENGDIFVYRATRQVEDEEGEIETVIVYGIMKIGAVSILTVDDEQVVSYEIDYAEGM